MSGEVTAAESPSVRDNTTGARLRFSKAGRNIRPGSTTAIYWSEARTLVPKAAPTFEEEGDQSSYPSFTHGFTRSLVIALTRFTGLRVFGAETALRRPADVDSDGRPLAADYLVTGQTSLEPDRFEVDVLLVEAATDHAVWAETFERHLRPSEIIGLRSEVTNRIARAGAALWRDPVRSRPRRRRPGAEAPRQLCRCAALLRLLAHL